MFIDLAEEKPGRKLSADIAIVGSGPAGLSVARRLESFGKSVVVIESGTLGYSAAAQELNNGGDAWGRQHYVRASRVRAFGGTSFHWGGWCRTLDLIDFERRNWINHSGWPISKADLASYYTEAA